jgi:2-dehydro-3-deoxygluconokinase
MARIIVIGEGMIELSPTTNGAWSFGYGGDTLNTAVHLARFGHSVAFASALGLDPFSDDLREAWASEGLDTSLIPAHPSSVPGLYAIRIDERGERSFTYWRSESAARFLSALPGSDLVAAAAKCADLIVLSLISLAILPETGRKWLLELCRDARKNGVRVAFDGNYRSRLWSERSAARAARDAAVACCDYGLPTLEDEIALTGSVTAEELAAGWLQLGAGEVVVKLGAAGCLVPDGRIVAPPEWLVPVDTSGAGDAFNAGYLHARLAGAGPASAATVGHKVASWTIMRRGAIPSRSLGPRSETPDFYDMALVDLGI